METRSAKRKRLSSHTTDGGGECDRLTDLPDAILHHILNLLPIKAIAQTSVLSRRWRQFWLSFPDLDFTTVEIGPDRRKSHSWDPVGTDFINQVLASRDRFSPVRALRFRARLSFSRLNRLMRGAVKVGVQELEADVSTEGLFSFPRSVLSSDTLRIFKLKSSYSGFRLPPSPVMKSGFVSLKTLSLSHVVLNNQHSLLDLFTDSSFPSLKQLSLDRCDELTHLSVRCRALEELSIEHCEELEYLDIVCGKLVKIRVVRCFGFSYANDSLVKIDAAKLESIVWSSNKVTNKCCLQNLALLCEAVVGFFIPVQELSSTKLRSVSNFLSGIASSHCLTLEDLCDELLPMRNLIEGVSLSRFGKLKSLELKTGFNKHIIPGLANLFRSVPSIDTLIIKIIPDNNIGRRLWNRDLWQTSSTVEERFWESQTMVMKPFLQHLKVVKMHGFSECENEISFVKFLLKHGKVLQEMFLYRGISKSRDSLHQQKIKSQILGFSRASCNAKIIFD